VVVDPTEITVEVVPTVDLAPERRAEIVDLCIAAHDEEDFRRLFSFVAEAGRHFLGFVDGELVTHAVVQTRWAQPEGLPPLRTAYVDAVSTAPDRQDRGYGTATMRMLGASVDDFDIACLQTDRPSFYAHCGWEEWRGPLAGRGEGGLIPTPDQRGVMVLRLPGTPALDLDRMLTIEQQPERIWE
jgi:aminoglycoside 2'-N-acetyltransferase I